jgi:ribosomal-protein-alanine N-acetyltransferase
VLPFQDSKLETSRLTLREFEDSDWITTHRYGSLPEVSRFDTWGPNSEVQTKEFVRLCLTHNLETPRMSFDFAVILKASGEHIGGCGLRIKSLINLDADFGYALHPDHWGKGYGTELAQALLDFGFKTLKLQRIYATCDTRNAASFHIMEKLKMKREAHLRKNILQKGEWRDTFLYARLSSD